MNMRDRALLLAGRGFEIFRVKWMDKTPLGKWKDMATKDHETIEDWPAKGYNLGVACGERSGAWVLDIDDEEAMVALQAAVTLPATYTIKTGKGYHLYFKWADGMAITNSHQCPIPKIDVRGNGGYVVAEGSTHANGHVYHCIDETDCVPAPADLLALLWPPKPVRNPTPPSAGTAPKKTKSLKPGRYRAYVDKALNDILEKLGRTPEGDRNNELFRAAASCGELIAAEWACLDRTRCELALETTARNIGLKESEIPNSIKSGITTGMLEPRKEPTDKELRAPTVQELTPEPEHAPHPELFKISFERGDDVELFAASYKALAVRGPMVFDRGALWQYKTDHWERLEEGHVAVVIERFAGCDVFSGKDPETGQPKYKPLKIGAGTVTAITKRFNIDHRIKSTGFFSEGDRGFPFANGFLKVTKDRESLVFEPHDKGHRQRWLSDVEYDPEATCPEFEAFLEQILPGTSQEDGSALRDCVLQFFGACLMGDAVSWQKALLMYGTGANGKSVLLKILEAAASKARCVNVSPQDMAEREYSRARLDGALINIVPDMPLREVMESGAFKQAVAGDTMAAREPYKSEFSFTPIAGHIMSVNHLPRVSDDSWGFRRRFITIPFTVTIPEEKQDQQLADRIIKNELAGVINLCISAFQALLQNRMFVSASSEKILLASWIYDGDNVAQWSQAILDNEIADITAGDWIVSSRCFDSYSEWCRRNNLKAFGSNKWAAKLATMPSWSYKRTKESRMWKLSGDGTGDGSVQDKVSK